MKTYDPEDRILMDTLINLQRIPKTETFAVGIAGAYAILRTMGTPPRMAMAQTIRDVSAKLSRRLTLVPHDTDPSGSVTNGTLMEVHEFKDLREQGILTKENGHGYFATKEGYAKSQGQINMDDPPFVGAQVLGLCYVLWMEGASA